MCCQDFIDPLGIEIPDFDLLQGHEPVLWYSKPITAANVFIKLVAPEEKTHSNEEKATSEDNLNDNSSDLSENTGSEQNDTEDLDAADEYFRSEGFASDEDEEIVAPYQEEAVEFIIPGGREGLHILLAPLLRSSGKFRAQPFWIRNYALRASFSFFWTFSRSLRFHRTFSNEKGRTFSRMHAIVSLWKTRRTSKSLSFVSSLRCPNAMRT